VYLLFTGFPVSSTSPAVSDAIHLTEVGGYFIKKKLAHYCYFSLFFSLKKKELINIAFTFCKAERAPVNTPKLTNAYAQISIV
jgi:hypothetical protein